MGVTTGRECGGYDPRDNAGKLNLGGAISRTRSIFGLDIFTV